MEGALAAVQGMPLWGRPCIERLGAASRIAPPASVDRKFCDSAQIRRPLILLELADNLCMGPKSDRAIVADQMLMAGHILNAFARGTMPMHANGYLELARWVKASFESMDSAALRSLREVAPAELQELIENVLYERRVVTWTVDDLSGLSSIAECAMLLGRCRGRRPA
jgi:hypothetical protein